MVRLGFSCSCLINLSTCIKTDHIHWEKTRFYALSLQEKMESLTSFLSEIFRNISMIKSYSLEKLEKNRINKSLDSLFLSLFDIVKEEQKFCHF